MSLAVDCDDVIVVEMILPVMNSNVTSRRKSHGSTSPMAQPSPCSPTVRRYVRRYVRWFVQWLKKISS
jgi:hypothetical protein